MELSTQRYTMILILQVMLLVVDLIFNTFIYRFLGNTGISILLFVLQDISQLIAFAVLLITFFQTNIFQAGFIVLLFNEFRSTVITGVGYFIFTLFVQAWTLTNRIKGQVYFFWPDGLYIFFVLHKFTSCLHYYLYKRTALSISDPKFYTDEWINNRINQHSEQTTPKF
ncbi:transmembrane protein 138 [Daktulosphaira vitifoliae]|uniref:transmembrane protein 138 n=1 Tax=Daktulosphaira vitifoliae TaxID=58002 RepID=UPI0021AA0E26|nr:transmembrane protein 138 [Daktulosphaira vitifoliae]XP_050542111.1 transmembrane protein 138 [Daktulosphaira vitifoliae]XP_050542112.1 transmembrane protein 138 [Daktulosphaira vitifoliae]